MEDLPGTKPGTATAGTKEKILNSIVYFFIYGRSSRKDLPKEK